MLITLAIGLSTKSITVRYLISHCIPRVTYLDFDRYYDIETPNLNIATKLSYLVDIEVALVAKPKHIWVGSIKK